MNLACDGNHDDDDDGDDDDDRRTAALMSRNGGDGYNDDHDDGHASAAAADDDGCNVAFGSCRHHDQLHEPALPVASSWSTSTCPMCFRIA